MKFWYGVERLTADGHWVASRNPTQELSTLDIPVVHLEKNCPFITSIEKHIV